MTLVFEADDKEIISLKCDVSDKKEKPADSQEYTEFSFKLKCPEVKNLSLTEFCKAQKRILSGSIDISGRSFFDTVELDECIPDQRRPDVWALESSSRPQDKPCSVTEVEDDVQRLFQQGYNDNGLLLYEDRIYKGVLDARTGFFYDKDHRLIEKITVDLDGLPLENEIYQYKDGLIEKILFKEMGYTTHYTFRDGNKVWEIKTVDEDSGSVISTSKIVWNPTAKTVSYDKRSTMRYGGELDSPNHLLASPVINYMNTIHVLETTFNQLLEPQTFEYDSKNRLIKVVTSGVGVNETTTYEYINCPQ